MTETNTTSAFPPGRYGRRRERRPTPRWVPVGLGAVVVLLGLATAVLLSQDYRPGRPYDATVERFFDITDEQVTVQFTVVVPEGEAAVCVVRARSHDGREVGREEVLVTPPAGVTRPVVVHRLDTTHRPVTGEVQRCWREPG